MNKDFKGKPIIAEFIGQDGDLGYRNFTTYKLEIRRLSNGRLQIKDTERLNGTCTYSSFISFMDNWTNIKTK